MKLEIGSYEIMKAALAAAGIQIQLDRDSPTDVWVLRENADGYVVPAGRVSFTALTQIFVECVAKAGRRLELNFIREEARP